MIIADEAIDGAPGRPLGAISTLVSLFLLLLVFFVLLFSIAQVHRQHTDEVLASVDRAFGGLPSRFGLVPPPSALQSTDGSVEDFVRSVSLLMTGFAPVSQQYQSGADAGLLLIDLPADLLFRENSAELTEAATQMLTKLAVLLQNRPNPHQLYRLTFRTMVAKGMRSLRLEQAASVGDALFAAGCPADALQVGLQTSAGAEMTMAFVLAGSPPEAE